MNASSRRITQFLSNVDFQFIIPVYQRNYDWSNENCEQLWEDIENIITINKETHFMGALVTIYNSDGGDKEYVIIDGQQRLTTISLLLLALHNSIKENVISGDVNPQQIMDQYLLNPYNDKRRIKLKPIEKDNKAFEALFENKKIISESNVVRNYEFFKRKISSTKMTSDQVLDAVTRFLVVEIELKGSDDNPQLIFESINSTGVSLSDADLVRNFVLMNLNSKTQEEYYKKYWHPIENNTEFAVSGFLRDYLTFKERITPNTNKVYRAFKKHLQKLEDPNVEVLLKDLLRFSEFYNQIANSKSDDHGVKVQLDRLNSLDMMVFYPFLLEVWNDWKNNLINKDQVIEILKILESYIFRRAMSDVPTNALNKIFMVLGKDLKKLMGENSENYVEIIKYLLVDKKASQRYPTDEEFSERLKLRDVYNLRSKTKLHLLQNLENFENNEKVDLKKLLDEGKITIEHVMPQTLTTAWQNLLGENFLHTHERYLNTIGNLTLTGYNSKMSNKPFIEKRDMENGFKSSRLLMNRYLAEQEIWNEEKIVERANFLVQRALRIWPHYNTNYQPQKDTSRLISIAEDHDFTGEKPESIIIEDKEFKVISWRDVIQIVMDYLYNIDSDVLYHFANSDDTAFSKDESKLTKAAKIADGLYVEIHLSSRSIINIIKKVLAKYHLDEESISIYLKDASEKE